MNLLIVTLAAFLGGCISGFIGWLDSKGLDGKTELFEIRKYGKSVFFALSTAITWSLTLTSAQLIILDGRLVLTALVTGMAIDVTTNRILGALTSYTYKPQDGQNSGLMAQKPTIVSLSPVSPPVSVPASTPVTGQDRLPTN